MTTELMRQLEAMSDEERRELIRVAQEMVRAKLDERLRRAAAQAKPLYEPGGELTEWTCLDTEDFVAMEDVLNDSKPGRDLAG